MEYLDLRKNYTVKELVKVINQLIQENEELRYELSNKVDYEHLHPYD